MLDSSPANRLAAVKRAEEAAIGAGIDEANARFGSGKQDDTCGSARIAPRLYPCAIGPQAQDQA
jgi:hypothetical protein